MTMEREKFIFFKNLQESGDSLELYIKNEKDYKYEVVPLECNGL